MIGGLLVKLAFLACVLSIVSYALAHRSGRSLFLTLGRLFYHGTVATIISIAALLLYHILTHQFQFTYVWSYSSRDLPTPLLVSTFYAGQEGSFMLWALFTGIIGIALMRYTQRHGAEPSVMAVFGTINLMLLLMLMVKSPFTYVWETWPGEVAAGFVPADGRGLNPLLQNYWMVIHPQVLFSGFASMGVPYAFAVSALIRREYQSWLRPATPWLVFGVLVLGLGIMLGGYWAYETLGWGGYWGWDPVENSSLVPWIVGVATIHTMLTQRKSGVFVRTNLILSISCFLAVLYSTFLTRSGVLGDTSVHSFVDPGMWVYWLLVGTIVVFGGGALLLLLRRWKDVPKAASSHASSSREFALFLGAAALMAAAILITVGTSAPLITDILYGSKSAVDIGYYSRTTVPLGIAIGVLAGLGQLLWWTRTSAAEMLASLRVPVITSIVITALLIPFGLTDPLLALFVLGAIFALVSNLIVGYRVFKGNPRYMGGAVAHVGVAVMFLGFVASSEFDTTETLSLKEGNPVSALGYTLTYTGYRQLEGERYAFDITLEKNGRSRSVSPVMYFSAYNNGLIRNPDIVNLVSKDVYVAPLALEEGDQGSGKEVEQSSFRQGERRTMQGLEVMFVGFEIPLVQPVSGGTGERSRIGVRLSVQAPGKQPVLLIPYSTARGGDVIDEPAMYDGVVAFSIGGVTLPENDQASPAVEIVARRQNAGAGGAEDVLVVEASVKPLINLVWAGVVILLVGLGTTIVRRSKDPLPPNNRPA